MPTAVAAHAIGSSCHDPIYAAAGIWAGIVMIVAVGGPTFLTLAGIVSCGRGTIARSWIWPRASASKRGSAFTRPSHRDGAPVPCPEGNPGRPA